jgi:N-acyl-D-amino-acid deacylase
MTTLIIRGGTVVDGTGAPPYTADVAICGEVISAIGPNLDLGGGGAVREIDARGLLVTPGWIDVHTHYDAQATWDPLLTPSAHCGVTTAIMGNCGVGALLVRPPPHTQFTYDWPDADIPGQGLPRARSSSVRSSSG